MSCDSQQSVAITKLLMRHRCALLAYILACVRNHADAEEVFQEVSVSIVGSFHKLNDEAGFLPWAREIARRQVLAFFRQSKRSITYDSRLVDLLAVLPDDGEADDLAARRRAALNACLNRLPPKSRAILALRYSGEEAGVDKIAERLGRTVSATYGLLKRLRLNLRECVERQMARERSP